MSAQNESPGYLPEERYRCFECQDRGWILCVEPLGAAPAAPSMRPCRVCRPVHTQRIKDGCLRGHGGCATNCATCAGIKDGSVSLVDFGPDGVFVRG